MYKCFFYSGTKSCIRSLYYTCLHNVLVAQTQFILTIEFKNVLINSRIRKKMSIEYW